VHAVVVNLTIDDVNRDNELLGERVVPHASGAAGFVAGYWTRSGDTGLSMVVYESEEAARAVADQIRSLGLPDNAVTVEGVEVREVVAHA
jgi:hypothetical protein